MLVIRQEQMDAFGAHRQRDFENRMVEFIADEFPKKYEAMGEEEVRNLIREGAESALSYKIEAERDIALFIELMVAINPKFYEGGDRAWARAILHDENLSGGAKVKLIYHRLM
ncbi:MAG: hypothetical protein ACRD68_11925 [Pyrinomonadaceae bacterium]